MTMDREALHAYVAEKHDNIRQIAALRGGAALYSDCWQGFSPDDAVHVMSVTKSVVSLLIGVCLDQGLIQSVRQPVLDFFPDYAVKRGEKTIQTITLERLLTMTAPYKYKSEPWTRVCTSDDWTRAALDLLGGKAPDGSAFRYSTLGAQILTGVIARQSGMETVEFANRFLFGPLGMSPFRNFFAETAQEHKAFMLSKEPKENVWFSDPKGVATAGYGLCMSARDMAKLGQLCLDGGVCGGKRIVSSAWIEESTRPRVEAGEAFGRMAYGYLWWTPEPGKRAYAALGNGGNVVYVNPDTSTVVAVSGTFKPRVYDRISFIREHIEPLLDALG